MVRKHNYGSSRDPWRALAAFSTDGQDHDPVRDTHKHYHLHLDPDGEPDPAIQGLDSAGGHSHFHSHGKEPSLDAPPEPDNSHDHPADHSEIEHAPGESPYSDPPDYSPPVSWPDEAQGRRQRPVRDLRAPSQRGRAPRHVRFAGGETVLAARYRFPEGMTMAGSAGQLKAAGSAHTNSHGRVSVSLHDGDDSSAEKHTFIFGPGYGPPAAGARLDHFPWARSWSAFMKAVRDDAAARKAISNASMSERIPAEGGFLVPEYLRQVVEMYVEGDVIRPRSLVVPMTSLRLQLPVIDNTTESGTTGVLGGMTFSIVQEAQATPASTAGFSRVVLEARKLQGLLQECPNELIDDGGAAFDSFIGPAVAKGMSWAQEDYFVNGTGVNEPEGLLNTPCAISVTRAGSNLVGLVDIANMWTRLAAPSMQAETAVWLCSPKVVEQLATLDQTVSGTPISASPFMLGAGSDGGWRLAGLPLFVSSHMPDLGTTGDIALCDFSQYAIGDRRVLQVERSAAGEGFINDTSDLRITTRVDGRWLIRSAVTPSDGSQTVSPVVILHS